MYMTLFKIILYSSSFSLSLPIRLSTAIIGLVVHLAGVWVIFHVLRFWQLPSPKSSSWDSRLEGLTWSAEIAYQLANRSVAGCRQNLLVHQKVICGFSKAHGILRILSKMLKSLSRFFKKFFKNVKKKLPQFLITALFVPGGFSARDYGIAVVRSLSVCVSPP